MKFETLLRILLVTLLSSKTFASKANNWAVIVCSSKYWFNYRHFANALAMYRVLKEGGYDDDHIIFMTSMEPTCDARNPFVGEVYTDRSRTDVYGNDTEIDYRGSECNVESFMRLLTGRVSPGTPVSKQLLTDENSRVFIYLTGHGGDEFLKFHDTQEISSQDMGYVFRDMQLKGRFAEILLVVDTCQASTFANNIDTSNIYTLTSSLKGENSYAYETNTDLGVAVLDRFTHAMVKYLGKGKGKGKGKKKEKKMGNQKQKQRERTLQDLVNGFDRRFLYSTATLQVSPGSGRAPSHIPLSDFFSPAAEEADDVTAVPLHPRDAPRTGAFVSLGKFMLLD
jgi:phosphatidylinositol glycan class K